MSRQWKFLLEPKLPRNYSHSFQEFVGDLTERLYPKDYIRVHAYDRLGDGGMDGF